MRRVTTSPLLAVLLVFGGAVPASADNIAILKPVKQGDTSTSPPKPGERTTPRTKQDPCKDVHTYRTDQARAMCVAERGFPDVSDSE